MKEDKKMISPATLPKRKDAPEEQGEEALELFLDENFRKDFNKWFKKWYGRYGNVIWERNLDGIFIPIWRQAGTRQSWAVSSMAEAYSAGYNQAIGKVGE